eukprot:754968-Hanusia_phi.AAC.1
MRPLEANCSPRSMSSAIDTTSHGVHLDDSDDDDNRTFAIILDPADDEDLVSLLAEDASVSHDSTLMWGEINQNPDEGFLFPPHAQPAIPSLRQDQPQLSAVLNLRAEQAATRIGKGKLTLGQKLDIIARNEAPRHDTNFRSLSELARMYGKSRSSISKILRPASVHRLKQLAASGVSTKIKRSASTLHPALEQRIHEHVVNMSRGGNRGFRQDICKYAEGAARELGIEGFKANTNWFHRFMRRHGF